MRELRLSWRTRLATLLAATAVLTATCLQAQVGKPVAGAPAAPIEVRVRVENVSPVETSNVALEIDHSDGWDEEALVPLPEAALRVRRVLISVSIDHWVFGSEGTNGLELLKAFLKQKLAAVKREYEELNKQQLEKLELAGRGDIKHFQERLAVLKEKYPQNNIDQEKLHLLLAEVQVLRQQLQSDQFFGNQSLLTKALRALVVKERLVPKYVPPAAGAAILNQNPRLLAVPFIAQAPLRRMEVVKVPLRAPALVLQAAPVQLRDDEYYGKLMHVITTTFDPETPFRDEQKKPLVLMLRKASIRSQIPLDAPDAILLRLAELPEGEYREILDPEQWNALRRQFEAVKLRNQKSAAPAR
ncbi:MAG: hypothetical protein JWM11_7681 [Planctomycetaceae bacterium]|nr:hypothetical protein [Planctomycetaceae bacterium]